MRAMVGRTPRRSAGSARCGGPGSDAAGAHHGISDWYGAHLDHLLPILLGPDRRSASHSRTRDHQDLHPFPGAPSTTTTSWTTSQPGRDADANRDSTGRAGDA